MDLGRIVIGLGVFAPAVAVLFVVVRGLTRSSSARGHSGEHEAVPS